MTTFEDSPKIYGGTSHHRGKISQDTFTAAYHKSRGSSATSCSGNTFVAATRLHDGLYRLLVGRMENMDNTHSSQFILWATYDVPTGTFSVSLPPPFHFAAYRTIVEWSARFKYHQSLSLKCVRCRWGATKKEPLCPFRRQQSEYCSALHRI